MTIDISALSWMIRRMDVSATLKTFAASFAVLTVLLYFRQIYEFATGFFYYGFDLDDDGALSWFIAAIAAMVVSAFTPFAFILWDWVARRPWRYLAAMNGALMGSLAASAIAAAIGFFFWFIADEFDGEGIVPRAIVMAVLAMLTAILLTWMLAESSRLRAVMKWLVITMAIAVLVALLVPAIDDILEENPSELGLFLVRVAALGLFAILIAWLIIRTVRHRVILSGNRPRELFLGALYRKGFWVRVAFLVGLPSSLWNLAAMKTWAFWAFLLARPMVYGGLMMFTGSAALYQPAAPMAVGAALIVGGHLMFYVAKRLAAHYAWIPGKSSDKRPPILFLRSFEDDQLKFRRPWWNLVAFWLDLWSFRRNADEAMIDEVAQYGPVVALGSPGETRVPFGARRYYAEHDDWQEIVTNAAKESQAIVIAAGSSPGVLWEYELLAREKLLDKTLLLFPPASTDHAREQNSVALKAFTETVGRTVDAGVPEGQQTIALLPTDSQTPALLTADKPTASAYVAAVRGFFQKCSVEQLADPLGL